MIEPPVGACTCASGSQVWTGHIGTLIEERQREAEEHEHAERAAATTTSLQREVVEGDVARELLVWSTTRYRMAASISMLPTIV